jgi:hypothetical protein
MYNANIDAPNPKSHQELVQDLKDWERVLLDDERAKRVKFFHGHKNADNTVLRKISVETSTYVKKNEDQFQKLIAEAKRNRELVAAAAKKKKEEEGEEETEKEKEMAMDEEIEVKETFFADNDNNEEVINTDEERVLEETFMETLLRQMAPSQQQSIYNLDRDYLFQDDDEFVGDDFEIDIHGFPYPSRLGGLCGPKDSPPTGHGAATGTTTTTTTTTTTSSTMATKSQFSNSLPQKRTFDYL